MMGCHARSEALFYYFRLEDQFQRLSARLIEKPSALALCGKAKGQLQRDGTALD